METVQLARPGSRLESLGHRAGAWPWTVTVFFSAALIFLVQPMYARMATPLLGGAPAVWNVSLVCFQAALLAGYAYAHLLARLKSLPIQLALHGALLCLAALCLPLSISGLFGAPDPAHPVMWLTATFLVSIAPPFAILSATAPLIQHWYARSGRADAHDPYHLYSASNAGSLLGLVAYPIVMEPFSSLGTQSSLWTGGYGLVALLLVLCGFLVAGQSRRETRAPAAAEVTGHALPETVSWKEKGYWLLLSAVPSGLLLGTTSHIATDIASAPFLWAPPLIAYIATFIIVFARKPLISPKAAEKYLLFAVAAALLSLNVMMTSSLMVLGGIVLHVGTLFMAALCLHGTLVSRRPAVSGLTEFYLLMSLGGVLGSAFVALVAPLIFNDIHEYPILLGAALLLTPRFAPNLSRISFGRNTAVALAITLLAVASVWLFMSPGRSQSGDVMKRGFFGVVSVYARPDANLMLMRHGNTIHGAQLLHEEGRPTPLTYYYREGPIGQAFALMQQRADTVGVVGLGAGSVACHARDGQRFTYYEIDPIVVEMATDPRHFSYLESCTPDAAIMLGDARITLADTPAGTYDLLLIDAFSSDAIPVHLLTREAMALYLSRLSENGVLVFHISNRHVDLVPILARTGGAEQAYMLQQAYAPARDMEPLRALDTSVMVFARSEAALAPFRTDGRWTPVESDAGRPWTDDYSNLAGALLETYLAE